MPAPGVCSGTSVSVPVATATIGLNRRMRAEPKNVANGTSSASRPVPMRMRSGSAARPVASNRYHWWPRYTSTTAWKSGGGCV